jgi:hypothetical protein
MLRGVFAFISTDAVFWFVVGVPVVIALIALGAVLSGSRPGKDGGP